MNWPQPQAPKPSWVAWGESDCEFDDDLPQAEAASFPDPMNSQQAAVLLGVSKDWVNMLAGRGKLKAVRKGRANFFYKADLDAYLAEIGKKDG